MKRFRLPKKIYLPGFTIRVEQGTVTDAKAVWEVGDSGGVIRLAKNLTVAQQKYYLSHELIHAAIDNHHNNILDGGVA